jgi:radical SAM superfamily enzyme YgiQ (UPF0313 family)
MNGRVPRPKSPEQFLTELDAIYATGFRGSVFVVDDNFIGNKNKVKETLRAVIEWQKTKKYPFDFTTEASLNLADDEELMDLMAEASFVKVFFGIETPNTASLVECNKTQNKSRDMAESIKIIQNHGLHALGGFIVGFDSDTPSVFEDMIKFIQKTGIVVAMVGILQALPKTRLHKRLQKEGRMQTQSSGDNTDGSSNFVPKMDAKILSAGYKKVVGTIYSSKQYYERVMAFLKEYNPVKKRRNLQFSEVVAFFRSIWYLGIIGKRKSKRYYWKAIFVTLFKKPKAFSEVVVALIYGTHFKKVAEKIIGKKNKRD